ncbi:hypothetical protein EDC01DRAFT_746317 [Geopyxis carbonaria]|nr:hypothetical protein EDC01DRAFT_746317 [Geopyxis carbonaria]
MDKFKFFTPIMQYFNNDTLRSELRPGSCFTLHITNPTTDGYIQQEWLAARPACVKITVRNNEPLEQQWPRGFKQQKPDQHTTVEPINAELAALVEFRKAGEAALAALNAATAECNMFLERQKKTERTAIFRNLDAQNQQAALIQQMLTKVENKQAALIQELQTKVEEASHAGLQQMKEMAEQIELCVPVYQRDYERKMERDMIADTVVERFVEVGGLPEYHKYVEKGWGKEEDWIADEHRNRDEEEYEEGEEGTYEEEEQVETGDDKWGKEEDWIADEHRDRDEEEYEEGEEGTYEEEEQVETGDDKWGKEEDWIAAENRDWDEEEYEEGEDDMYEEGEEGTYEEGEQAETGDGTWGQYENATEEEVETGNDVCGEDAIHVEPEEEEEFELVDSEDAKW